MYMSEKINESVFDSSKWFLISFIDVIIIFVNLLLFFIAFLYVKGVKKRNKKKLKQFKTSFHLIALFWDFLYVFLNLFFQD